MNERETLEKIWWAGVDRVRGYSCVSQALAQKSNFTPTHIAAVGKAAFSMISAALDHSSKELPALAVTKYDHVDQSASAYPNLKIIEAAHPVPDANSLAAGEALLDFVGGCDGEAKLLLLVSGGASALAESLPAQTSLDDLQHTSREMLAGGLNIASINEKRCEISNIKGGKLLARFRGAEALVLAISDVEGDAIEVIGSGIGALPQVRIGGEMDAEIIASNALARLASENAAEELKVETIVNTENLYGDILDVAKNCAETVRRGAPGLYVFGGEPTTVLPTDPGEGGRNQALAVAMAREVSGAENVFILVAGTDGSDGPTPSAGGFVTGESWNETSGGEAALAKANTGDWLRRTGGLFVSGPTGTNVMDIMLVLKR